MNVKCNFFVAICVWQIIWSANGIKLSLTNVSSKSAPVKPSSSSSKSSVENTISSSTSKTSQASFLSNPSTKTSNINQEGIRNGLNFPIGVNNFPQSSPVILPGNSVTAQNIISNSLKEIETTNLASSVLDPKTYQSLLSTSTSNLETTNNNLLSAIQNSLNVQNNNLVAPQSITSTQLFNNGFRESLQNTESLQRNLNNNLISSALNLGPLQSNIANNNIISTSQNVLDPNLLSILLSNSQNLEEQNNNLLSSIQMTPQSLISSSLINDLSLQNIGSMPAKSLNNNLISYTQNSGLLPPVSNTVISSLQNELLESNALNNLVTNTPNVGSLPNNELTQTLGAIQPNSLNTHILSGTQNMLFNTINNNKKALAKENLLQPCEQNKNAIKASSNSGSQKFETLSNNIISSQNIAQINNVQNSDINAYFSNLGPLQSIYLKNVQNPQNVLTSQIDTTSNQFMNPSFTFSPNSINNNVPFVSSLSQSNYDCNSIQSRSNNNLVNSSPGIASISNSNNVILDYLTANNLLASRIPTTEITNSLIQNGYNSNPLLSETLSNKIALSEVLPETPLPVTNPYNKFTLPTPAEITTQNNLLTNSDVVSNYNKNVLLQQLNNNIYENAVLNNNNLQTQNLLKNSGSQNSFQNNVAQSNNLEKALLQNLLASRSSPIDNVPNLPLINIISENNIFSANNQHLLNNFSNNVISSNSSNIGCYLYNNLMNKLQPPKPITNKVSGEIDVNNQINLSLTNNEYRKETSISNNVQNSDYLNTISNTQSSSTQTSADIISKVNNLPKISPSLPASFDSLINNNINNPNTAYLNSITQTITPPNQLYNGIPVTGCSAPTVPNLPNIFNLPQQNNFAPTYNNLFNNKIPLQSSLGPISPETSQLYSEIANFNILNNLKSSPLSIGLETPFNTVSNLRSTDISECSEIKTANSVSSSYPLLSNLNPTLSNIGSINPEILSSQAIFPTNIAQPSLRQSLYPITGLPSVNTNLGPIDNNFLINSNIKGNFQKNALSNLVSPSPLSNLNVNGIIEGIQIKPSPYLPSDIPTPDLINRLKLLESYMPEKLSSISPEYLAYLNLISKVSSQSPFPVQQNPDLSAINLSSQFSSLNNFAENTEANLNSNPFLTSNPIQTYNNFYSALGVDSLITTNSLPNTESTEIPSDGQISVSTSIGSTDSSGGSVTESTSTNPYAIPSIADLPNVLASNYLSLPQLYNNLYNQISPSNLIVPKIENLISTAGLTKSITDLGNDIAKRYIDNLKAKKTKSTYPPLVYDPALPSTTAASLSSETIISNSNISPTIPTQPSYSTNLAVPPPVSSTFTETFKEVEQIYPFIFSSLPQTSIQTETSQVPILPTFYPTEISVYPPRVLPTPNINYPVYPPYIPTPPMSFPPIPPLFPPMPSIIETPILKMGSNGQDTKRLIELLLITGLINNNDCNDRGALEALIALMLAT